MDPRNVSSSLPFTGQHDLPTGAAGAWSLLATAVYQSQAGGWHDDTGVEWNALSSPPTSRGIDTANVYKAWELLVKSGVDPMQCDTFNYDVVNVGREVMAQLITSFEHNLTAAVKAKDKSNAILVGTELMAAYADLDELLECEYGFLMGVWIRDARMWANATDGPASYYEWQARSQVSTWWPVAPSERNVSATFDGLPILDNYANKHWNGLVREFYAKRVQCYVDQLQYLPDVKPKPGACKFGAEVQASYLSGYPKSLGSGGTHPPSIWPYDTGSLDAASGWCCNHTDCGGVTHQNGQYEVRADGCPVMDARNVSSSFPKAGACGGMNRTNLTRCVVLAELDFTQDTSIKFAEVPAQSKTLSLSSRLLAQYRKYFS
jgi:hypothetical protein